MPVTQIQLRRGTAADWTTANPTLAVGEVGVETNTGKVKVGDGVTAWATLPYVTDVVGSHAATAHGFPGGTTDFLRADGAFAAPPGGGGGSDWTHEIIKSADQTVTNNAVLQNDSELFVLGLVAGTYLLNFSLLYSGNDTNGRYSGNFQIFNLPAGSFKVVGYTNQVSGASSHKLVATGEGGVGNNEWPNVDKALFTDGAHTKYTAWYACTFTTTAVDDFRWRFANTAAAAGRESTTKAGSILRLKKLA